MTKREMFNAAIAVIEGREVEVDRVELIEGLSHEIELLDARKSSKSKGMTKTQKENKVIMEKMLESLAAIAMPCTVTELLKHGIEGFDLSNQKASALLRQMVEAKTVAKTMEGKKAYFSIV